MPELPDEQLHELYVLAQKYAIVKERMAHAKISLDTVKAEIVELVETGEKSQRTVALKGGWKMTVARDVSVKGDIDAIEKLFATDHSFDDMHTPVASATARTLDPKGYEWYKVNRPDLYAKIAEHVTVKPKAVSVTVKLPKEE